MPRAKKFDELMGIAGGLLTSMIGQGKHPEIENVEDLGNKLQEYYATVRSVAHGQHVMRPRPRAETAGPERAPSRGVDPAALVDLEQLRMYPPPTHPLADPAVSVAERVSGTVGHEELICLECGKPVKLLKTHLSTVHHGMTWAEYLARHALPAEYPTAPAELIERQRARMKRYRGGGGLLSDDELVRKRKKKSDVTTKPESNEAVHVDFSKNNPRNRPAAGDDDEGLGKTG